MVKNSWKGFFTIPYSQPADGVMEKNDVDHFQVPLGSQINIGEKIGEGDSANAYKAWYMMRPMAIKQFKGKINTRKTIKVSEKLLGLKQENIVEFLGYSFKPYAFAFEYCEVIIDGD